MGQLFKALTH